MSRSPDRRLTVRAVLAVCAALAVSAVLAPPAAASPSPPPAGDGTFPVLDIVFPVEDIRLTTESLDASESETRDDTTVTVALTSDVLFALDKADLTGSARDRLADVAAKIKTDSARGAVEIAGHTDDQGADGYNMGLSERRAQAVRGALRDLLAGAGTTLNAKGYGETRPRVPNVIKGKPVPENRALNRRVEIVYEAAAD